MKKKHTHTNIDEFKFQAERKRVVCSVVWTPSEIFLRIPINKITEYFMVEIITVNEIQQKNYSLLHWKNNKSQTKFQAIQTCHEKCTKTDNTLSIDELLWNI